MDWNRRENQKKSVLVSDVQLAVGKLNYEFVNRKTDVFNKGYYEPESRKLEFLPDLFKF